MVNDLETLVTDFAVNQRLTLKMDLPSSRETVLDLFGRLRRDFPDLSNFRRFENEFALESDETHRAYTWFSLRGTQVGSGSVNPDDLGDAYRLHRKVLDLAPWFLSISPLDVEHLELVFVFDMEAQMNRDEVVYNALLADSPLAALLDHEDEVVDAQPMLGINLEPSSQVQAFLEIKTRTTPRERMSGNWNREPISVFLTMRHLGGMETMEDLASRFAALAGHAERIAEQRVMPNIIMPIRHAILASP
jgi:hypothetical protein